MIQQITAQALKSKLDQGSHEFTLLDVREPHEHQVCQIEGSVLLPMQQVPPALNTFNPEQEIVVMCHHGMRSMQVAEFLQQNGFSQIINLQGGIDAWALSVDSSMQRY